MYREDHKFDIVHYNFTLHAGGLGDLIAQLPAVKYVLDHHPQIIIHFWTMDYGVDLCKKVFKGYKNIIIKPLSDHEKKYNKKLYGRSPYAHNISNLSYHMTDHAFLTIVHKGVDSCDKNYLKLEPADVSSFKLPEKYIVITTGFTSATREWLPESVNNVSDYIINKGYTPVYLGKSYTQAFKEIGITGNFNADYSKGINLIDHTNLIEAHGIMENAKCVMGLDNGLLHLAAMSDVPIVYGFTSVDPIHRLPYRNGTMGYNCYVVTPTTEELACIHCQSNFNFAPQTHCFTKCYYKDYACLKLMTADKWIIQLEKILIKN